MERATTAPHWRPATNIKVAHAPHMTMSQLRKGAQGSDTLNCLPAQCSMRFPCIFATSDSGGSFNERAHLRRAHRCGARPSTQSLPMPNPCSWQAAALSCGVCCGTVPWQVATSCLDPFSFHFFQLSSGFGVVRSGSRPNPFFPADRVPGMPGAQQAKPLYHPHTEPASSFLKCSKGFFVGALFTPTRHVYPLRAIFCAQNSCLQLSWDQCDKLERKPTQLAARS